MARGGRLQEAGGDLVRRRRGRRGSAAAVVRPKLGEHGVLKVVLALRSVNVKSAMDSWPAG